MKKHEHGGWLREWGKECAPEAPVVRGSSPAPLLEVLPFYLRPYSYWRLGAPKSSLVLVVLGGARRRWEVTAPPSIGTTTVYTP